MSNLLEILKAATEDLANSPSATDVALRTTQLLQQIKEIQPHIMKHPELASILAYKSLRSLQEIDFLNVAFRLENRPANKQFQIVTAQLREILTPIFKENVDFSVSCGREFLRLALDKPLICEFNPNFRLELKFLSNPSPEFLKVLIPESSLERLQRLDEPPLVASIAHDLVSHYNPETAHFFICDYIRYAFSSNRLSWETKLKFVLALLENIPNKESMVNTVEVGLCLCLDLFTFQRVSADLSGIRAFFGVFHEFPGLAHFIERMGLRHPTVPTAIAEAMAVCNDVIPFSILQLPQVEAEPQRFDTQTILNQSVQKLKWQKNSPTVLAECSSQLLRAILQSGPCLFDVPVQKNKELSILIKSSHAILIGSVCVKNPNLLKLGLFEVVMDGNVDLLKQICLWLFATDSSAAVLPALCKVLVLKPDFAVALAPIMAELPPSVDPSPFIRFICFNCTGEEIANLTQTPLWPSTDAQGCQLLKDSLKWRLTVQCSFWMVARRAFLARKFNKPVLDAVQALIKQISDGQVASFQVKVMLKKTAPGTNLLPLVTDMTKGTESVKAILVAVLGGWSSFFPEDLERFIQNRVLTFRSFYEGLVAQNKAVFPDAVKAMLFKQAD
jgi:hypothetical protein